jgi:hypothetical protein
MKVLPDDIVITLKGHKVYSSVSPAALGIWSDGEFGTPLDNYMRFAITYSQMPALEQLMRFSGTVVWVPLLVRAPPPPKVKRVEKEAQTRMISETQRKIPSS